MGVLFILVFVLVMTLAAFYPNDGLQESADSVARRGEVAASAMVAYHSAATRSCYTPQLTCANGVIPAEQVMTRLPTAYAGLTAVAAARRYVSFSNGYQVFTAYYGTGQGPGEANMKMRSALDALMRDMSPDTKSRVGFFEQSTGLFRPLGNVYYVSNDPAGNAVAGPGQPIAVNPAAWGAPVPDNAPMVVTRIRSGG